MQTFYARTRRIVAALLIPALVVYAALALTGGLEAPALVSAAATIIAIVPLCFVVATSKPRLGLDTLAFLIGGISVAVCWGGSDFGAGYLTYLPAIVAAIGFATMALTLRTEASVASTEGRL
ncbi:hypothetical protein DEU37_1545 [Microbacterium sp. AG790]|uniref:hypothetical protein n=1 Tax=Microbacterium sp. AG790 TaxID=2183995 RepID=UPI000F20B23E|nr:hypothetical protein [Microbacterium sp. AG790]RKS90222.1 hypothetical protein DEU37_1545 [Microbacterium sp. AG790]